MPEDTNQEKEVRTSEKTSGITRRRFIKDLAIATGIGVLAPTVAGPVFEKLLNRNLAFESTIQDLIDRVENSALAKSLPKEEGWSKRTIAEFLKKSLVAERNFESLSNQPEVEKIKRIVRKKFSNPDIEIDDQIFFLRDRKIFRNAITRLGHISWETEGSSELEIQLMTILETSDHPVNGYEQSNPSHQRSLTPKNIVFNYEKMGTRKTAGNIEVITGLQTQNKEAQVRMEQLTSKISKILSGLPLSDLKVNVILWEEIKRIDDTMRGQFQYFPWVETTSVLDYHFQIKPSDTERETLLILHEAGHALDITINPTLMQFFTPSQIARLTLLREQATLESFSCDIETLLGPRELRGETILPIEGKIGQKKADQHTWFLAKSRQGPITPQEFNLLIRMYPERYWLRLVPLLDPWYEKFQPMLSEPLRKNYDPTLLNSWEEFFTRYQNVLDELTRTDPIFTQGFKLLQPKLNYLSIKEQKGEPISFWLSPFSKAIETVLAEDLIRKGASKSTFTLDIYNQLLKEFQMDYKSAEQEGLADALAFLLYLDSERDQKPEQFASPYWEYFKELRRIIKNPEVRIKE